MKTTKDQHIGGSLHIAATWILMLTLLFASKPAHAIVGLGGTCDLSEEGWAMWLSSNQEDPESRILTYSVGEGLPSVYEVVSCDVLQPGTGTVYNCDGNAICTFIDGNQMAVQCSTLPEFQGPLVTMGIPYSCPLDGYETICNSAPAPTVATNQMATLSELPANGQILDPISFPSFEFYLPDAGFIGFDTVTYLVPNEEGTGEVELEFVFEVIDCNCAQPAPDPTNFVEDPSVILTEFVHEGKYYYRRANCLDTENWLIFDCWGNIICSNSCCAGVSCDFFDFTDVSEETLVYSHCTSSTTVETCFGQEVEISTEFEVDDISLGVPGTIISENPLVYLPPSGFVGNTGFTASLWGQTSYGVNYFIEALVNVRVIACCLEEGQTWEDWLGGVGAGETNSLVFAYATAPDQPLVFEVAECGMEGPGTGILYECNGFEICAFENPQNGAILCADINIFAEDVQQNWVSVFYSDCIITNELTVCDGIPAELNPVWAMGEIITVLPENGIVSPGQESFFFDNPINYYLPNEGFVGTDQVIYTCFNDGQFLGYQHFNITVEECDCSNATSEQQFYDWGLLEDQTLLQYLHEGEYFYQITDCVEPYRVRVFDCLGNLICSDESVEDGGVECELINYLDDAESTIIVEGCDIQNCGSPTSTAAIVDQFGTGTSIKQWLLGVNTSDAILWMPANESIIETACNGELYDSGGPDEPYDFGADGQLTLDPFGTIAVSIKFTEFDYEPGFDTLFIFDGLDISAPLIGAYTGTDLPNGGLSITSNNVDGALTLWETSDQFVSLNGFAASFSCDAAPAEYVYEVRSCPGEEFYRQLYTCQGDLLCDFSQDGETTYCPDINFPIGATNPELIHNDCSTDCTQSVAANIDDLLESAGVIESENIVEYEFDNEFYYLIQNCLASSPNNWRLVDCQGIDVCAYSDSNPYGLPQCHEIGLPIGPSGDLVLGQCFVGFNLASGCTDEAFELVLDFIDEPILGLVDSTENFDLDLSGITPSISTAGPIEAGSYLLKLELDHDFENPHNVPYHIGFSLGITIENCIECNSPADPIEIASEIDIIGLGSVYQYSSGGNYFYVGVDCGAVNEPNVVYDCHGDFECAFFNGSILCDDTGLNLESPELIYTACGSSEIYESCGESIEVELPQASFEYAWYSIVSPQNGTIAEDNYPFSTNAINYQPNTDFEGIDSLVMGSWTPMAGDPNLVYEEYFTIYFDASTCTDCNGDPGGSAVFDLCGNCLEPTDPNFNACLTSIDEFVCNNATLDVFYPDAITGPNAPFAISQNPEHGTAELIEIEGGGYQLSYDPANNYVGPDVVVVTQYSFLPDVEWSEAIYIEVYECGVFDVYPGDIDYDGIANNYDVIYFGIGFGDTGPVRENASTEWIGQQADDWEISLPNGIDEKHSDCDGNGEVELADKDVILQNYGLEHTIGKGSQGDEDDPPLYLDMPENVEAGQLVEVPIILGSELAAIQEFYGIAFTIEYDPEFVEEGTVNVNFMNSVLGQEDVEQTGLHKTFDDLGRTDIGVTRLDKMNWAGNGEIGILTYVMADDIIGKQGVPFSMNIVDVLALSIDGSEVLINAGSAETDVQSGLEDLLPSVGVFPNPANQEINLDYSAIASELGSLTIRVIDLQGSTVLIEEQHDATTGTRLDVSNLPNGLYFLEMTSGAASYSQKIQIMH